MSRLHVDIGGQGPELVLLHGWGMHAGLWGSWLASLRRHYRVHAVDLPGHGLSPAVEDNSLRGWSLALLDSLPERAHWIGWSLGGLLALSICALCPRRVEGLLLLASTPRFVAGADWPDAVDASVFDQFARQLEGDSEKTLLRFLSLQVRGSTDSAGLLRCLRQGLAERPRPQSTALTTGLELLRDTDLRGSLPASRVHLLLGGRDTLVPPAVARHLAVEDSLLIESAGHTPFLSHPGQCLDYVTRSFPPA